MTDGAGSHRLDTPLHLEVTEPAVRIRHLTHYYGEGEARRLILSVGRLDLLPGEIVIMTGPSGSGKTTLLTLMGALRSVQSGSLRVLGRELNGLGGTGLVPVRRGIGFIFQHHNLFDSLTAVQNVRLALELYGLPHDEVLRRSEEALIELSLGHRLHSKPRALSGGQRQRVAIARALAHRPRLVLADEPTAALDKESGRNVIDLFQDLVRRHGCTILIVTHDNRILDAADRMVNLVDGRIVSDVSVREALTVAEFLAGCPAFSALTPSELTLIAEKMVWEQASVGSAIVRQGDPGDKFYLIRKGSAEVVITEGGASRVVRHLGPGDSFGEMALMTGEARKASVVAREPLSLYALSSADFHAAIDSHESFKGQLLKVLFQRQ